MYNRALGFEDWQDDASVDKIVTVMLRERERERMVDVSVCACVTYDDDVYDIPFC